MPFVVRLDLSRDTNVLDGRHVDQETSGQRDVRRDARAFLGDRLFGDLDQYLLAFTEQVRDCGLMTIAARLSASRAVRASGVRRCSRCSRVAVWRRRWAAITSSGTSIGPVVALRLRPDHFSASRLVSAGAPPLFLLGRRRRRPPRRVANSPRDGLSQRRVRVGQARLSASSPPSPSACRGASSQVSSRALFFLTLLSQAPHDSCGPFLRGLRRPFSGLLFSFTDAAGRLLPRRR